MMMGKKAENEKKNEPHYFTKSVANPTGTNLSIFGKFSVRVFLSTITTGICTS